MAKLAYQAGPCLLAAARTREEERRGGGGGGGLVYVIVVLSVSVSYADSSRLSHSSVGG